MNKIIPKHKVIVSKNANKDYKQLPKQYQKAVKEVVLNILPFNPYYGKKLQGDLHNNYSIRKGVYRILYEIYKDELVVYVISIEHRSKVYVKRKN